MDLGLEGKVVVITGGGGAIGSAIAAQFARERAVVVVTGRHLDTLEKTITSIREEGGMADGVICDVTDSHSVEQMVERVVTEFGSLVILVNNAGINGSNEYRQKIYDYDDGLWDRILHTDLYGVYNCSKYAIRQMRKQKTKGNLVNISSVAGVQPLRLQIGFTAAKAGVINMSKAMALEMAEEGVRINVICPGSIMFEGTKKLFYNDKDKAEKMMAAIPVHHPGEPSDIACAACFLASDKVSPYTTGEVMVIDGGWSSSIRYF